MKNRRIMAAALTLALAFALALPAIPVFAAGDGSITISNSSESLSISGHTFSAYRIFELESYSGSNYAYKIDEDFEGFTYEDPLVDGKFYTAAGPTNFLSAYLEGIDGDIDALNAFAEAVYAYIGTESIAPDDTGTGTGSPGSETAVIDDLELGYYLVYSGTFDDRNDDNSVNLVAAHILTTTDPTVTVSLKADLPIIEKKVSDNATSGFGDSTDLAIGDTAYFQLTSKVPNMAGYASYAFTIHDTLSSGLTFDGTSVEVTVGGTDYSDYTLVTESIDPDTFCIVFDPDEFINLSPGADIVVSYSAELNADAVVTSGAAIDRNPNEAYIQYSNNPNAGGTGNTVTDEVYVYSFKLGIHKYRLPGSDVPSDRLSGAAFELRADAPDGTAVKFAGSAGSYKVDPSGSVTEISVASSGENLGQLLISGLDAGTYYLVETEAPEGYNALTESVKVEIAATYGGEPAALTALEYSFDGTPDADGDGVVAIGNSTGIEFPESGGIGRTIFIGVGLLLMLGAGVLLIARRKAAAGR
ncbi:MAG: isopeptide-forming domain-containing fimbrial protein [Clostridiales Family XIII bacterium]|nr:isopeptide-forming domain-containing fimbrial protein [Clostridiales Family XIII bacterium]